MNCPFLAKWLKMLSVGFGARVNSVYKNGAATHRGACIPCTRRIVPCQRPDWGAADGNNKRNNAEVSTENAPSR